MKKLVFLTLFMLIFTVAFAADNVSMTVNTSTANGLDVAVSLPDVQFVQNELSDGNTYSAVVAPGGSRLDVAAPDVPALASWILIPNGTDVEIDVNPGNAQLYENIDLAPVQQPKPDLKDAPEPEFVKDEPLYSTDADYPGLFAEIDQPKTLRGQELTLLWIYPYQYNPVQKTLSVYPDLQVSVSFHGIIQNIPTHLQNDRYEYLLKSIAINGEDVILAEKNAGRSDFGNRDEGAELIIVVHDDFEDAANTLSQWKTSMGISNVVAKTSEIGETPEMIEAYIDNAYDNWDPAPSYLLFLGDSEFVPTFHVNQHPYSFGGQGRTGTDIFYGDVDEPADYIADMAFGRIPVDTPAEADSIVSRIIQYEKNPPTQESYYTNAAAACYFQDNDGDGEADRRFSKTSEDIRNYLYNNGIGVDRIYKTESSTNPTNWTTITNYVFENDTPGAPIPQEIQKPGFPWNGNATDINNVINDGRFFLLHRDHGYREGWGDPDYDIYDVDDLDNGSLRPIVWTLNCETGWYDNETDDSDGTGPNDECFVEHWIRHPSGGSMGLIAATRVSYSGHNDRLSWGYMDAIWPDFIDGYGGNYGGSDPILNMGDVVNYAKSYMLTKYSMDDVTRVELEMFHWFGDPTMKIWTQVPEEMLVEHIGVYLLGSNEFQITVTDESGIPLEEAAVALSYDGALIGVGTTDANGEVNVTIDDPVLDLGSVELVVTSAGKRPHIEDLPIVAGMAIEGHVKNISNDELLRAEVEIAETGFRTTAALESGFYRVYVVDPGNYTLRSEYWGYDEFLSDSIYVADDDTTAYDILMDPVANYATIEGVVTNDIGEPLEGVEVSLVDVDLPSTYTDANGQYSFSPLVPEYEYDVRAYGPSYEPQTQTTTPTLDETVTLDFAMAYIEIFEETDGGFTGEMDWEWGTPTPDGGPETVYSGEKCWGTNMTGDYEDNRNIYLYTTPYSLTLSTTPSLIFYTWYEIEDGWDGGNVQISIDGGENWDIITPDGGYPDNSIVALTGGPGFTGNSEEWLRKEFDLTDYTGNVAQFRLRFASTNSHERGWFIDNFTVNGGYMALTSPADFVATLSGNSINLTWSEPNTEMECAGFNLYRKISEDDEFGEPYAELEANTFSYVDADLEAGHYWYGLTAVYDNQQESGMVHADGEISTSVKPDQHDALTPKYYSLAQNFPNPFNPETEIVYSIPEKSQVELKIYNLQGQLIRTLVDEEQVPSFYNVIWNGRDDTGKRVSSGVYIYRISAGSYQKNRKMLLLK